MTFFQLLMLGTSAYFAFKIYEHIQTLQNPKESHKSTPNEAQPPIRTAEAFSTFDVEDLIEKADDAVVANNLDKALAIYSEANIKVKGNGEVLFKMGYVLALQKRDDEALEYFKEALEVDNENPFSHLEMAYIYLEHREYATARTHLNAALALDPELQKAQVALERLNTEHADEDS